MFLKSLNIADDRLFMLNSRSGINGFGQGREPVRGPRKPAVVVLNDDGHYLSRLQYSLRDRCGHSALGAQGSLLEMWQCLAGDGGDRAGQTCRRLGADASSGSAEAGAGGASSRPCDTASSCRGATSNAARATSRSHGFGYAYRPLPQLSGARAQAHERPWSK